jgi:glucose-6-phosphate isomerase
VTETRSVASPARFPSGTDGGVDAGIERAIRERWASRIWDRDATVWSNDPGVMAKIDNRLGWLDAPDAFRERVTELEAFAEGVRAEGYQQAVVCGMGGSSLAPEVLALSYPLGANGIPIDVLDSTDPDAVLSTVEAYDPQRTLYLIASKSGTTTETLSFLAHLWEVEDKGHGVIPDAAPGAHFVAITDPGKSVDAIPHTDAFRGVFLNPEDVGGRYSALTYVGLVPGALLGIDLRALLNDASQMAERCREDTADNPGLQLGVALGAFAAEGRDKLTLLIDPRYAAFGAWAEQLIAESTGKRGVGVVPIDSEPLGDPASYGADRLFVRLAPEAAAADQEWRAKTDALLAAVAAQGHPVIDIAMEHGEGLGGEFFRWEFATAIAGAVLGIDPFDEPNVTESKDNTRRVLTEFRDTGRFPEEMTLASEGPLTLIGDAPLRLTAGPGTVAGELRRHLERLRPSSYLGIHAYLAPTDDRDAALTEIRRLLRERTALATTLGYGPRFLHSTGQLHKGGPRTGWFLQLVAGHPEDVPIPGEDITFGNLIDAQALGDFVSLESHDLPVMRIHLSSNADQGLAALREALAAL